MNLYVIKNELRKQLYIFTYFDFAQRHKFLKMLQEFK